MREMKQPFRIKVWRNGIIADGTDRYMWAAYPYNNVTKEVIEKSIGGWYSYSEETAEKEARQFLERTMKDLRDLNNAKIIEVEM